MSSEYPICPPRAHPTKSQGAQPLRSRSPSREHMSTTGEAIHVFNCPKVLQKWPISNIVKLLNSPADSRTLHPRVYRAAAADIFTVTLVLTWGITLIFHPEQIFDHPARKIIGSLNPCFGWDYPPASYIARFYVAAPPFSGAMPGWRLFARTCPRVACRCLQRSASPSGPPSSSPPLPTSGCCCGSSGLRMATGSGTRPSSYCMPSRHSSRASGITSRRSTTRRDVTTSRGGNTSTMPSLASPRCSCQQSTSQTVRAGHPPGHPPRSAYPREDQSISPSRRLAC